MALQQTITLDNGLQVPNAYIRISTLEGNKEQLTIKVMSYVSRQGYLDGVMYVLVQTFTFKPSVAIGSENFIRQGYEYIKKLPEFEKSSDVFEPGQLVA
ncbi:hypothetical protein [Terribacillus sp. JSM ZJ617]|uniref:hypothetical protein n=1 Tax=Terribacillus sp. JSM ZJ617 TaxID=3342119 RepID=UPI0035A8E80C